jgi:Ca2+-binding EF-hand superfamily protein
MPLRHAHTSGLRRFSLSIKEPAMKITTLAASLVVALGVGAAGTAAAMHHEKFEAAFKAADKDADGTLDREEAKAMPRVAKNFDAIDADKSGTVSMQEITAGMKKAGADVRDRKSHARGEAKFAAADKDKDGTLDKEEAKAMPRVAKHFDEIDADKDGTVSKEEIHTFMKEHHKSKDMHKGMHKDMHGKDGHDMPMGEKK